MTSLYHKRLYKDIEELHKNPIDNVYIWFDESDITKLLLMIIGPENTPYENGYFILSCTITKDFPWKPPLIKYLSTNGIIRFHPFLYENGKVCLSILGTWAGPQWTSAISLKSLFISIQSILNNKPLLDEPGHQNDSDNASNLFNEIIKYYTYEYSIIYQLEKKTYPQFYDIQKELFQKNYDNLILNIKNQFPIKYNKIDTSDYIKKLLQQYTTCLFTIEYSDNINTQSVIKNILVDITISNYNYILFKYIKLSNFNRKTTFKNTKNELQKDFIKIKIIDYIIYAPSPFSKMGCNFKYNNIIKKLNYLNVSL